MMTVSRMARKDITQVSFTQAELVLNHMRPTVMCEHTGIKEGIEGTVIAHQAVSHEPQGHLHRISKNLTNKERCNVNNCHKKYTVSLRSIIWTLSIVPMICNHNILRDGSSLIIR
jgi:hypothetical protein